MVDRILSRTGVGIALLFMVVELSYINSKSLQFMFDEKEAIDMYFGIIGAIAFSIVTVLIMRLGKQPALKIVFPVFDIALVFCGFNLQHADDITSNPIRFAMSIFLSLFSGLITYSLGQINAQQHDNNNDTVKVKLLETEINTLKSNLAEKDNQLSCLKGEFDEVYQEYKVTVSNESDLKTNLSIAESNLQKTECNFENLNRNYEATLEEIKELKRQLKDTQRKAETYEKTAMAAEVARIRKKAPKNRTDDENNLLTRFEMAA